MATKVTRFTTHYLVNEPGLGLFDVVDDLSTIEYKTEEKIRLGYIFDKDTDTVRIPVGVGDDYIKSVFNVNEIHQGTVTPFTNSNYKMLNQPTARQTKVIAGIVDILKEKTQVLCDLPTGCVDEETEFYSVKDMKWIKIKDYKPGMLVRTVKYNKFVSFDSYDFIDEKPLDFIKKKADKFYAIKNNDIDMVLSPEHNIVYFENNELKKIQLQKLLKVKNFELEIPVRFNIECRSDVFRYEKTTMENNSHGWYNKYTDRVIADYKQLFFIRNGISTQQEECNGTFYLRTNKSKITITHKDIKEIKVKDDEHKYCFTMPNGMWLMRRNGKVCLTGNSGKTFTATYLISAMKLKALIIVGTDNLRKQWVESFLKHTDIPEKRILLMEGAKSFGYNYPDKDIFITTHHTIRSILPLNDKKEIEDSENPENVNPLSMVNQRTVIQFNKWLAENGIGVKVFDEADLETASMFKIDMLSSVMRTIYLTATDYKSSQHDDRVFQLCLKNVEKFGSEYFADIIPDRTARLAVFHSKPGQTLYARAMSFSNDFSPVKYCEYLFMYRQEVLMDFCDYAKQLWEFCKTKHNPKARLLITVSRKAYCFILRDMLMERWGMTLKDIGVFNSAVDPKWKQLEFNKPIIISTLKSMGRGTDAPNLMVQYDSEPYSSESMFYQAVGRTARNGSKGYYIAHYDLSYLFISKSYQKKKKVLKKLFKEYEVKNKHYDFDVIDRLEAKKISNRFRIKWYKYLKEDDSKRKNFKKIYSDED